MMIYAGCFENLLQLDAIIYAEISGMPRWHL